MAPSSSRAVPGIAIKIGPTSGTVTSTTTTPTFASASLPSDELADNLYGMYVQATRGAVRQQWIILPPPLSVLGVKEVGGGGMLAKYTYLNRTQNFEGNRAKWYHMKQWENSTPLDKQFKDLMDAGWDVIEPVVVPIELDDYLAVWNERKTPHKYIRAIDKALSPFGLTTK